VATVTSDPGWTRRVFEVLASLVILGVVVPIVATFLFVLISMFPVILLGQREEVMVGWGWITVPMAFVASPAITVIVTYALLSLVTSRVGAYLAFGAVAYCFLLTSRPFIERLMRGGQWLYECLK